MDRKSKSPAKDPNRGLEEQAFLLSDWDEKQPDGSHHSRSRNVEIEDVSAAYQGTRPAEQRHLLARTLLVILLGLRAFYNAIASFIPCLSRVRGGTRDERLSNRAVVLAYSKDLALFLMPSPIRRGLFPTELERQQPVKIHPTGFLDGLRGSAALAVFIYHFTNNVYGLPQYSYGAPATNFGENNHYIQLPVLKVVYAGPAAVCVFFVVSGFALSVRPIALMRSHDDSKLMGAISSAVFRRAFRLFLPCIISTFLIFMLVRIGVFDLTRFIHDHRDWMTGRNKLHLKIEGTFSQQFWDWFWKASRMNRPFHWDTGKFQGFSMNYDAHLWTIAIEYRASIVLYLTQMGVARLKPTVRMFITALLIWYAVVHYRWEMVLFWSGAILAELHMGFLNPNKLGERSKRFRRMWWLTFLAVLFLGLFLVSYPDKAGGKSPGYMFLTRLIPRRWEDKRRFWQGWGAVLVVFGVQCLPPFARFMGSGFPRYLGQISFALYLVHGVSNRTVGYTCLYLAWKVTGRATDLQILLGYFLAACFHLPLTFWIADIFWRTFDIPTTNFAKWLEGVWMRTPKAPERNGNLEVRT